jgi:hypothetical protein
LALIHFVFEGIIAPSMRMSLRNKLFELRDEIRELKEIGLNPQDEAVFWHIHDGINSFINKLPHLTVHNQANAVRAYKTNPHLKNVIDARIHMMESCTNSQLKTIFTKTTTVVEEAFLINMGGWFFYVLPIAVALFAVGYLKRIASSIIVAPSVDTNRLFKHA